MNDLHWNYSLLELYLMDFYKDRQKLSFPSYFTLTVNYVVHIKNWPSLRTRTHYLLKCNSSFRITDPYSSPFWIRSSTQAHFCFGFDGIGGMGGIPGITCVGVTLFACMEVFEMLNFWLSLSFRGWFCRIFSGRLWGMAFRPITGKPWFEICGIVGTGTGSTDGLNRFMFGGVGASEMRISITQLSRNDQVISIVFTLWVCDKRIRHKMGSHSLPNNSIELFFLSDMEFQYGLDKYNTDWIKGSANQRSKSVWNPV